MCSLWSGFGLKEVSESRWDEEPVRTCVLAIEELIKLARKGNGLEWVGAGVRGLQLEEEASAGSC